jgi:WD40 repeat protein
MGLTKQYRRFVGKSSFGVIGSAKARLQTVPGNHNWVVCARAEDVIVWNVSSGEKVAEFSGDDHEVTALVVTANGKGFRGPVIAAGYHDGSIRLLEIQSGMGMK